MAWGWHLERRTLHQDAQGEQRRVLRVHVALGGPISVGVVKSRLFFLVRGVIKEETGDSTVSHFNSGGLQAKRQTKKPQ